MEPTGEAGGYALTWIGSPPHPAVELPVPEILRKASEAPDGALSLPGPLFTKPYGRDNMSTTTLLIIILVIIVLGGGFYGRGRWF
jgi:hypothetical protein